MTKLPRDDNGRLSAYAWPGGYNIGYLDRAGSVLCVGCARKSDEDPEEVPQFKPMSWFTMESQAEESDYCDQCGTEISTL